MISFLLRLKGSIVVAGILLLLLGLRISEGIRFVVQLPQGDDLRVVTWLHKFSEGIHDWGFIWQRPNGHFFVIYYLVNLGQFLFNGYWDPRFDFLTFALIHTIEAAVVLFTFRNLLNAQDRSWIYALIFFLFAVPFGGYRIAWGNLWTYTDVVIFALPALYLTVYHRQRWLVLAWIVLAAAAGTVNTGAGCLGAGMIGFFLIFRAIVSQSMSRQDIALTVINLGIFFACFLTMPKTGEKVGLLEAMNAFLKALAWPVVFSAGAGFLTLIPLVGLVAAYVFSPSFRQKNVEYIIAVSGFIFLLAFATGAFRGDNNNMGMPSGRYTDLFLIVPLTCAIALCLLYRGTLGKYRFAWGLYAWVWAGVVAAAFSIQVLYRTIPFMAHESGEWVEPGKQMLFREAIRNPAMPLHFRPDPVVDIDLDLPLSDLPHDQLLAILQGKETMPAMSIPMITGFPLSPGSQGNYIAEGYPSFYSPRPGQIYTGSFDPANRRTAKSFVSQPFTPQTPYITMDLLVDKKARFTNYRLSGLELALVDKSNGQREELLPQLSRTYPFVFRDWESVYARVIPGHEYQIESHADDSNPTQWVAFAEPIESGRLTPLIVGLSQSGKLFCLIAVGLLILAAGLDRLQAASTNPEPSRSRRSV